MQRLFLIWIAGLVFSCRPHPDMLNPSFACSLTINDPTKDFYLSVTIRPNADPVSTGLLYVDISRYREKNVLRKNLTDTMALDGRTFSRFTELVRESKLTEHVQDIIGNTDGNVYQFEVSDSGKVNHFTVIGHPFDGAIMGLIDFYVDQFETRYSRIDFQNLHSKIDLTIHDRINAEAGFSHIEIAKSAIGILWDSGRSRKKLSEDSYLELCRTLENNNVWKLSSNREFEGRYPKEYIVKMYRGRDSSGWTVFAPSKLSDQRYYSIITRIETIGLTQTD